MTSGYLPPDAPQTFSSPLAQPALTPPAPVVAAAVSPAVLPVPARKGRSAPIWLFGILVFLLIALIGYFLSAIGPVASAIGAILALLPLAGVVVAVAIVDRWEPEPRGLLILAAAWGAVAAVAITLGVDIVITMVTGGDDSPMHDIIATVVQAPIVEELAKGLGVLLIFATARRAFDGPVDGIVYGALVGAGFAFTENIQYFAISLIEGGVSDVAGTFFVRGILSPFAHVMFTSVTGFALGLAARRGANAGQAFGPWLLGVSGAILLHAFWNGSAVFTDFYPLYISVQVPLFVLFILGIVALRREESRLTRSRLGEYAAAGWFTPQEVDMLATPAGRRSAMAWAATLRGDRGPVMKGFIRDAAALAAARQRAVTGRDPLAAQDEAVLLQRATAARAALFAP